ncbi:MAG: carboxypeptidase regulatory-like domain-containing protein [Candidatus Schekmanbacteria bacterium]|nr:carboxypeptidase regulatory-like domain-containing protein [Candidatus Schekmanbacteria bacterium]
MAGFLPSVWAAQPIINSVTFGQHIEGSLETGDHRLYGGQYCDWYSFEGQAGQKVLISLISPDFDPVLQLLNAANWRPVAIDDDHGGGMNAALGSFTLPYTGTYLIWATSYYEAEGGGYSLSLNLMPQALPAVPLSMGQSVSGSLNPQDAMLAGGEYLDAYSFAATPSQAVCLRLNSADFKPFLRLLDNQGRVITASHPGADSSPNQTQVVFLPYLAPSFTVWVSSAAPGATGNYSLSLNTSPAPAPYASAASGNTTADLTDSDYQINSGQFADLYAFNGVSGQKVSLSLSSSDFDSYLRLLNSQGNIVKYADDVNISNYSLPTSGTYLIWASSVFPGNTGGYTLSYTTSAVASGVISGRVTNACSGSGIGNASVLAGNYFTHTDDGGYYNLSGVAVGSYTVSTAADNYQPQILGGITVPNGGTAATNFSLSSAHNPVLANIPAIVVNETETVSFTAEATDQDGDPLTYTITGWQCGSGIAGANFSYRTTCEDSGIHTVRVTVDDGACGRDEQVVQITVIDVPVVWYEDADGDGYSSGRSLVQCARPDQYYLAAALKGISGDCDDHNRMVNPGAMEFYDALDNNCNGQVDEDSRQTAATAVGANIRIELLNCAITFENVLTAGQTSLAIVPPGNPPSSSTFQVLGHHYDISTTAVYKGKIGVCFNYPDDDLTPDEENNLYLLHYKVDHWEDITTSLDTETNTLCGQVSGFSQFILAIPTTPNYDVDEDGYDITQDCNDNDPSVHPEGEEICDGKDNNCNGQTDEGYTDTDKDKIANCIDNCLLVSNPNQRDSNGDGCGNICDADLDNDGYVSFADLALLKAAFGTCIGDPKYNQDADFDGDNCVSFGDLAILKKYFGKNPGPGQGACH